MEAKATTNVEVKELRDGVSAVKFARSEFGKAKARLRLKKEYWRQAFFLEKVRLPGKINWVWEGKILEGGGP